MAYPKVAGRNDFPDGYDPVVRDFRIGEIMGVPVKRFPRRKNPARDCRCLVCYLVVEAAVFDENNGLCPTCKIGAVRPRQVHHSDGGPRTNLRDAKVG